MKTFLSAAVLALLFCLDGSVAFGQSAKSTEGDRLTNDVWVRLTLKNGAQVEGLATGGLVYERLEKGRFVGAKPDVHRDAGLRLHFVDYNEGFLFIRARDIQSIDSQKTLTTSEQAQIRALVKRRQEAVATTSAAAAASAGAKPGVGVVPGAPSSLAPSADQARKQLFAKFPPADGWGPVRRDEILKKRWTVGVFPDAQEREFLDNYEDWMTEYQSALEEETPKDGESGDKEKTPPAPLPPPPPAGGGDGAGDEKVTPPGENATRHGGKEGRETETGERRRGE